MKNFSFLTSVAIICLLGSCSSPKSFSPTASSNPWPDDYIDVASISDKSSWGTYNVHDPSCRKIGKYYYMYSTDAIFYSPSLHNSEMKTGFIQVRRSLDLVHWEFKGWAFTSIPQEAIDWVHSHTGGEGATNIWAPFIIAYQNKYRLYYCVSAFGRKTSYIGMAESESPEGPWRQKGCVVKTNDNSVMNAIDPSVIVDSKTNKWWMHYGSFFGGLYCMELNPDTGLALVDGDQGHLSARRANGNQDNQEAPEIIFNKRQNKAFLFSSYDPLMTTYNVRAGRSDKIEGPFLDIDNNDLRDTINHYPLLIAPYRFEGHPGWAGTGHCGVICDNNGKYFMVHQGRLSPENLQMVLHVRQLFFTPSGWPIVSPERYTASKSRTFKERDLVGKWEIIHFKKPKRERELEDGQVLWGEGHLLPSEVNTSFELTLKVDHSLNTKNNIGRWSLSSPKQLLDISIGDEIIKDLLLFSGHDWERNTDTILFSGLDKDGCAVWGKRIF